MGELFEYKNCDNIASDAVFSRMTRELSEKTTLPTEMRGIRLILKCLEAELIDGVKMVSVGLVTIIRGFASLWLCGTERIGS